jgi:tetratricopeptide (TPR) repeat protein
MVVEKEVQAMAGMTPMFRCSAVSKYALLGLVLMLAWPGSAQAGWFVRNNQIAYRLAQEGHDRQALNYWDESAEGLFGRGTALMHLGQMREAEQAFRQSLEVAPHKTGFSDDLQMPVASRPGFMASVWYNLGNALYAQDELAEARQAWLTALGFQPGHAKARHNLEIVDRILGDREQQKQQELAGLGTSKPKKPGKTGKAGDSSQHQMQQTAQRGLLRLHTSGASQQSASSGGPRSGKESGAAADLAMIQAKAGNHAKPPSLSHRLAQNGNHSAAPGTGGRKQNAQSARGKGGMSPQQAENELRMVEEGVSVFLRHRLSEHSSQVSSSGGDAW